MTDVGVVSRLARWAADRRWLPDAQRAVLGYYAETGTFDYRALALKSQVDDVMDEVLAELYEAVETELAREFDLPADAVSFAYETKLTLPAELTLGYLFRRYRSRATGGYDPVADELAGRDGVLGTFPGVGGRRDETAHRQRANRELAAEASRAREMTAFVVWALLDGDMRDAINDDEFEDFVVDVDADARATSTELAPRRVARVAQSRLQSRVEAGFDDHPDAVRAAYDHAVEVSEAHQAEDDRFRGLMAAAADDAPVADETDAAESDVADRSPEAARDAIEGEYKYRQMADDGHPFTDDELDLPYLTTQYDRVGVIYHGMLEMYRGAGFEIEPAFERSIVFAIIGAQVWLDDVDDYHDDVADGQLTPVTAEYLLADSERAAFESIVEVAEAYFDPARAYAEAADSTLTGIAVEYILRSGDVSDLPGADG
ncbi:hypothetical protein [Salinigranum salinum]|uniref:hypothetical protein n=1 Tax=Salinigranum salinum TaxID=1364937 RepID=UPI0012604391|nr:hypothetical protein [Salinigranum salinum]